MLRQHGLIIIIEIENMYRFIIRINSHVHEPAWFIDRTTHNAIGYFLVQKELLLRASPLDHTFCCLTVRGGTRLTMYWSIVPSVNLHPKSGVHMTKCLLEFLVHESVNDRVQCWIREPDDLNDKTHQTEVLIGYVMIKAVNMNGEEW